MSAVTKDANLKTTHLIRLRNSSVFFEYFSYDMMKVNINGKMMLIVVTVILGRYCKKKQSLETKSFLIAILKA